VIAASAGNHAQAVAYHATQRGIRSQIVMPLMTPLVKVAATRGFGAEVVLCGANYDEACAEAILRAETEGLTFLHPFDDPEVIQGQGSIGLEILEQVPDIEAVVVPIGGGGLIGGVACAIKETNPKVRVIGVQTERLPSMLRAYEAGEPVTVPAEATIADGIAVRRSAERTLHLVERYVDELVTVDEEEIASAILVLLEREKTLAEGAGAAALAAVLQTKVVADLGADGSAGLRRQYRREPAGQDHRARLGERWPLDAAADSPLRPARCAASTDEDHCGALRKHRPDAVRPRLLRREPGRHGDRLYAGDSRAGAHRGHRAHII
jgi:threonine dehydratase